MPHPVHSLLQRFLDTQQYAFDPRERALWPSERFPQASLARKDTVAEPAPKGRIYDGLEYQN
jgi:hypothetical protein